MKDSNTHNNLVNFTNDFFNTLEDSFMANSFDYSRDGIRSEMSGKSQIFRQLKQETIVKLQHILTRTLYRHVLDSIWFQGQKRRRRSKRTQVNVAKALYKLDLMYGLKTKNKISYAFNRMAKFSTKYAIAGLKDPKEKRNITFEAIINQTLLKISYRKTLQRLKSRSQFVDKVRIFSHILNDFIKHKGSLNNAFQTLVNTSANLSKKQFFIQSIFVLFSSKLRQYLTEIKLHAQNFPINDDIQLKQNSIGSKNEQQEQVVMKERKTVEIKKQRIQSELIQNKQYDLGGSNFFRQSDSKVSGNEVTRKMSNKKAPLKFNRGVKKNSEIISSPNLKPKSKQKKRKKVASEAKNSSVNISKQIKLGFGQQKKWKVSQNTAYSQKQQIKLRKGSEKNVQIVKINPLNPQNIHIQLPDIMDLDTIGPSIIPTTHQQKKTNQFIGRNRKGSDMEFFRKSSQYLGQKYSDHDQSQQSNGSRRIHQLQKKDSLQFGDKNKKLKFSQVKKSSIVKDLPHTHRIQTEPNTINFNSLKQYYFPEQINNAKYQENNRVLLQRNPSLDVSGHKRWLSRDTKNRLAGRQEKMSPDYFDDLRKRYGKKPIDSFKNLQRFTDYSGSSRSSSKMSNGKEMNLNYISSGRARNNQVPASYTNKCIPGRNLDYSPLATSSSKVPRGWLISPQSRACKLYQNPSQQEIRFKFENTRQKRKTNM